MTQLDFTHFMQADGWFDHALSVIEEQPQDREFTADDIRVLVGAPTVPNLMGALFRSARALGFIESTGRIEQSAHPARRGGADRVWRRK